jgi:signal peptidase I
VDGEQEADGETQAADEREDQPDGKRQRTRRRSWLTEMVVLVIVALVIAMTIKTYLVQPFKIPTGSMEDTLLINDKVLVNKLVGHISQIHRGDVVVFDGAGSWDQPVATSSDPLVRLYRNFLGLFGDSSGQTDYIKRVIGLPGDHVVCCDAQGLVTVNGVPLHESSYLYPGSEPSAIRFNIVVPPGRLWVMGDNRGDSDDSRLHRCGITGATCEPWDPSGTIPESMVIGRAFLVIWPPSQFKVLWVPATYGQPGLAAGLPAGHDSARSAATDLGALRVVPTGTALPLVAGLALAAPLTLVERRIRLRRLRRPASGRRRR